MANQTANYTLTVTTIFSARQTELHDLARPLPTLSELVDTCMVGVTLFLFTTFRTWLYVSKGRNAPRSMAPRIVACLWLVDAMRFVSSCERLYGIRVYSAEQLPLSRESISRITRLLRMIIVPMISTHVYITFVTWTEIYTATGYSKIQALLWTAIATFCPGVDRRLAVSHCLAFARLGFIGTARALMSPDNDIGSGCPRLRMSSGLAGLISRRPESRRRRLVGTLVMLLLNYLAIVWIRSISATLQMKFLPGHQDLKVSIPLSSFYTALYLSIRSRQVDHSDVSPPQAGPQRVQDVVQEETQRAPAQQQAPLVAIERPRVKTPPPLAMSKLTEDAVTAYLPLALALGTAALCG
ncbi:unnamed protein product [Peniophora sp. CBMAI 1063]|nr:unnamed protein product [Peniophora sp. CBMAI 1063]